MTLHEVTQAEVFSMISLFLKLDFTQISAENDLRITMFEIWNVHFQVVQCVDYIIAQIFNFYYFKLIAVSPFNKNLTKIIRFLFVEWSQHMLIIFVFLFLPPWSSPWVAKPCWWRQCNKITFINLSTLVGIFNKFHAPNWCFIQATHKA